MQLNAAPREALVARGSGRRVLVAAQRIGGRTRKAVQCHAALSSGFLGQRVAGRMAVAPAARKAGRAGRLVVKSMFERFTEKAIKVVMLAQEEARRLGHNFVGTEQLLLGLIGESTGIAAKVLKSMGVNLKDARVEVEKIIGRGSGFVAVEIPFTPRAKRVLEMSLEEARQLGASGSFAAIAQQLWEGCQISGQLFRSVVSRADSWVGFRDRGWGFRLGLAYEPKMSLLCICCHRSVGGLGRDWVPDSSRRVRPQATTTSAPSTSCWACCVRARAWPPVCWRPWARTPLRFVPR